jgi:hypothetical protein
LLDLGESPSALCRLLFELPLSLSCPLELTLQREELFCVGLSRLMLVTARGHAE